MRMQFKILLLIVWLLLASCFVALAQEPEATDAPSDIGSSTPIEAEDPDSDVSQEAVTWLEQIAFASGLVTFLVGVTKYIPVLKELDPRHTALGINLSIWVLFILAQQTGSVDTFIAYVTDLGKLSDIFMRIVTTYLGGAGVYHASKAAKFPVLGKTFSG